MTQHWYITRWIKTSYRPVKGVLEFWREALK